jgi:hypothetical protein
MDTGNFRHRDRIESQPATPIPTPAEVKPRQRQDPLLRPTRRHTAIHGAEQTAPCTRVDTPTCHDAAELGSAAVLFQIAQSQAHPNPREAVEILRQRLRENLKEPHTFKTPTRWTVLRDMVTTTDSRWIPAIRWMLLAGATALLGALLWHLFVTASTTPVATAAASCVLGMIAY